MKNKKFNLKNYAINFVVVLFVAALFMQITPMVAVGSAGIAFATGTVLSFIDMPTTGMAYMAIQVEIWQNHIEEELFKDNSFLRLSHNADQNVINSKAVHIPQSGGSGNVVKNRSSLPAAIRKRTDTDVIYLLDEYTTDPVTIPHIDTAELSYDKRNSVLGEDRDKLVETVAEETLMNWISTPAYGTYAAATIPSSHILQTTGANVAATADAATGVRKGATRGDLQRMRSFFKNKKRWFEGMMYCMITPEMEAELFPADDIVTATYMAVVTEAERREGIMYKCQGWKIMTRNSVYRRQAGGTILAPGAAGSATDNEAALFWYTKSVEFAFGNVVAFEQLGAPTMYGDVYSFLVRAGGRARRASFDGIALLEQAPSS